MTSKDVDTLPNTPGVWQQKRRLSAAMRRVIERLVTTEAPEEELRTAANRLERYADQLAARPQNFVTWGNPESSTAGSVGGFFDLSPLIGQANPLAPPIRLWVDGDRVRGAARFGWAYQGPPAHLHGGFVAALFDEALGMAQSLSGNPGMTGTLTVRYRKPTPLYRDLTIEAWVDRVEGRKIFTTSRLYCDDTLLAEAEAIFVSVDLSAMQEVVRIPAHPPEGADAPPRTD